MLGSLILFPIMLLCTRMSHLALDILPMLKCLKRNLILHQTNPLFHLRLFDASYVLTNKSGKVVAKYVGGQTQESKDLCLGTQGTCF